MFQFAKDRNSWVLFGRVGGEVCQVGCSFMSTDLSEKWFSTKVVYHVFRD